MRRVEFSASREKTINIIFPYDVRVIDIVKKIEGRKFDPIKKLWYAKPIASNIDSILGLASYGFAIDKDVVVALKSMQKQKAQNIIGSQASTAEFEVEGLGGELMPFQKAGVMYASRVKRCLLGDEMGLGKSIQALATIHNLQTYPAIIVCPASLKYNWEKEAKKWLPTKTIQVITSKTKALTADITILNYDLLKKWLGSLSQLSAKAIIYDECHLIKSNSAARTKAAKVLSKNIPVRLGLSGTPILNRPQELVSQLTVLGRIDDLGGLWKFLQRYCNAVQTKWGWDMSGASNMEELNDKLRAACYIRRLKKNVLPELPDKRRTVIAVDIDNKAEYNKAQRDIIHYLSDKKGKASANAARNAEELIKIEVLKKLSVDGKMAVAEEWIENFLETGEKLVVFAHHRDIIGRLVKKFPMAVKIIGGDDAEDRQSAVEKFQTDDDCKLIICSIQSGGVGITLTAASNVVFLELGWNPAIHDQAEDRCHRIGQKDAVNAWYLLGRDTIDEDIWALIEKKRQVVDAATDGEDGQGGDESILAGLKRLFMGGDQKVD